MDNKFKALGALFLTIILFSFVVILTKAYVADISPMLLLYLRMFFASLLLFPYFLKSRLWSKKGFIILMFISSFSTVNVVFFVIGIQFTSASASQLIYSAQPILTILVSNLFLKEKYSSKSLYGVIIGLIGILYIIYLSALEKGETISGGLTGNLIIVIAMLGWFTYILKSKNLLKVFSPMDISTASVLVSFAVAQVLLIVQLFFTNIPVHLSPQALLIGLYLGWGGTVGTYILMQYALKFLTPLTVNLTSYIQPICVAVLAILLLGERLTTGFIFGSILVIAGIFLSSTMEFIHKKRQ